MNMKSVALGYDESNLLVSVVEIKTLSEDKISELKKTAQKNVASLHQIKKVELESLESEKVKLNKTLNNIAYVCAKSYFDNLVEKGAVETTQEFEDMFSDYLKGGSFNEEIAPISYKNILGRIKEWKKVD